MSSSDLGDVPMNLELRLSVEDSPNSAGIVIDAIRVIKLALERGIGGALEGPAAYFMKHPPLQLPDHRAKELVEHFIMGELADEESDEVFSPGRWGRAEVAG